MKLRCAKGVGDKPEVIVSRARRFVLHKGFFAKR